MSANWMPGLAHSDSWKVPPTAIGAYSGNLSNKMLLALLTGTGFRLFREQGASLFLKSSVANRTTLLVLSGAAAGGGAVVFHQDEGFFLVAEAGVGLFGDSGYG